jgi:hypothetical protein
MIDRTLRGRVNPSTETCGISLVLDIESPVTRKFTAAGFDPVAPKSKEAASSQGNKR